MIKEILDRISSIQAVQDTEGHEHPGLTQVYTFECPFIARLLLKIKRIKGLEFERYQGRWFGIYRAQK